MSLNVSAHSADNPSCVPTVKTIKNVDYVTADALCAIAMISLPTAYEPTLALSTGSPFSGLPELIPPLFPPQPHQLHGTRVRAIRPRASTW